MTATTLTGALQQQVKVLEDDLRARVEELPEIRTAWTKEHAEALARKRTAASWQAWRDERVMQAAVAWVLTTVFVRFCEDNALVAPVWIAGPPQRRQEAIDAQFSYFHQHPEHTDREWLEQAVAYLAGLPATAALVDAHSPLHLVSPSGDAAGALLAFWRERDEDGPLTHDLTDQSLSTRFLGDLYQDLSTHARDTYALLQTPEFVEEFILDRTLEPALAERPLEGFRLIDPTCGSGHFLIGAFARLLDRWHKHAPGMERQARVQAALDAVHGVDLNPFAIAIARFRLTIAALRECGLHSLEEAPAFHYHLVTGDSLLHGSPQTALDLGLYGHAYATEDLDTLHAITRPGRYDVVVGNPPYITVRDKALNAAYRDLYGTCKGTYALTVPFMECFFGLAKPQVDDRPAGWVGQITSNSFMKREFGVPLIETFLIHKDLRLIADTSGASIPGHNREGTPTVIIVGRNRQPQGPIVRAVLGIRNESGRPENPAKGTVWRSIVQHIDEPGHDDGWTSTVDLDRSLLAQHPWSLSGGGAAEVRASLEGASECRLGLRVTRIGFFGDSHSDEAFFLPSRLLERVSIEQHHNRKSVRGEDVRDWSTQSDEAALFPYNLRHELVDLTNLGTGAIRFMWPLRNLLANRSTFGGETYREAGRKWWEWHQLPKDRGASPFSIAFAFKASHNHFVLDQGGKVFNRTAPVIKLPEAATKHDHLKLLGLLNSSTVCFWLRQNAQHQGGGAAAHPWSWTYEFGAAIVAEVPLPAGSPLDEVRLLDALAQELARHTPAAVCEAGVPTRAALDAARAEHEGIRARMILVQEELDWEVYRLYGLVDHGATCACADLPGLALGERAFEIALARQVAAGEEETGWFTSHGSTPVTDIPAHWPGAYRELVRRRLDLMASDRAIRLLEQPEYKRRWQAKPWEKREKEALRDWLLDRLEDRRFWFDAQGRPTVRTVAQLADEVARDRDLASVLALWVGRPDAPVTETLVTLLADQAVPFLAAYRYKESGLRKREAWEHTWAEQRREDRGERLDTEPPIPVPPKYTSNDFAKPPYWRHRGKLDVPKERFILYPASGRDTDPTPLLGWAGWDHAQQALALNMILQEREADGWPDERLVPLVAGLAELQPWLDQWHTDVDPAYGVSLAAFCGELLSERMTQVGLTAGDLRRWRPAPARRGRRSRTTGAGA